VSEETAASGEAPAGSVLSQDPPAGTEVGMGTVVRLVIGSGPGPVPSL
jgi:beta-lactam-binding protein with PASTA domain